MNLKSILTTILIAISAVMFAQTEQITGVAINRIGGNAPIEGATVLVTNNVDEHVVTTDAAGQFAIPNLSPGIWRITISAPDFDNYEASLTLHAGAALNLGNVFMFPELDFSAGGDDGMEMETEGDDLQGGGLVLLGATRDVFTSISNARFSQMRFRARGYDFGLNRVFLNGLLMNDMNTGSSPFSLWGGLNDVTRNTDHSRGMQPTAFGVGGVAGSSNLSTNASRIRRGFQINYAASGGIWAHRLGVAWANPVAPGWYLAVMGSVRYTPADNPLAWDLGTYAQGVSYFVAIERRLSNRESLSFTFLGAPNQRGMSGIATHEVQDLVQNPFYNPNIGWQNGQIRNARIRNSHEPIAMLEYSNRINQRLRIQAATSFRFGRSGTTAIDWFNAPDPRPDHHRSLPSWFTDFGTFNPVQGENAREGWLTDRNIRYINWDGLYNVNFNNWERVEDVTINGVGGQVIEGLRSKYIVENRRADQREFNAGFTANVLVTNNVRLTGGLSYRWNRTHHFKEMVDLLGGEFWIDLNQFAQRVAGDDGEDYEGGTPVDAGDRGQLDLNNPNRVIREGDIFGYSFLSFTQRGNAWAVANITLGRNMEAYVGGELGFTRFHREGLFRHGLFPENSYGNSNQYSFLSYIVQAGLNYQIGRPHLISANVFFSQQPPLFTDAFLSPRTRNSTVDNLVPERIFSVDLIYSFRAPGARFRIGGFYTEIHDRSRVSSFFDDVQRTMSNFALSGISQRHMGIEFGADVHIWNGISLRSAVAYGDYIYTSNPLLTQTDNNSDRIVLQNERVYWSGFMVSGTPQLAANIGLEYRARRGWWAAVDLNYYNFSYIRMNPRRRMDDVSRNLVSHDGTISEAYADMVRQERFSPGFVLNANIGRFWSLAGRRYQLGTTLSVSNILNNQSMRNGGFEQSRLWHDTNADTFRPFQSRYSYMNGTSFFLNVFFRF